MESEDKTVGIVTDRVEQMACSECQQLIDTSEIEPFAHIECPKCGATQTVPARLGDFMLLDLIGTGGMGGVYYAKDETLGRFVAIKVMLRSLGENEKLVQTFRSEAQAVAKLNHPNIAQIYSFGQEKGQPYIVMELVSGSRLDDMIEQESPLDQAFVVSTMLQIAEGLDTASEVDLVHGDIKPENILFDEKMQAKLVDFGLATLVNQAAEEGIWGTPYYISPEKVRRKKADARSDIYSLGATMYHALAGHPPFEGETPIEVVKARLEGPPPPLSGVRDDINPAVETLVTRMLAPEPTKRYPNYRSLMSDMRKALDALGGPAAAPAPRSSRMKRAKKSTRDIAPEGGRAQKIVIKKSGGGRSIAHRTSSAAPTDDDGESTPQAGPKERRKTSKTFVVIGILLMLTIAGFATWRHFKAAREREISIRREAIALKQARYKADEHFQKLEANVSAVGQLAATIPERFSALTGSVHTVEGTTAGLTLAPPPPVPPEPPAEPAAEAVEPPAAEDHAGSTDPAEGDDADAPAEPPAETGEAQASDESPAGPDAPAAADSTEDPDAAGDTDTTNDAVAHDPNAAPAEAPLAAAEPVFEPPPDASEIVRMAYDVARNFHRLQQFEREAGQLVQQARSLHDAAGAATRSTEAAEAADALSTLAEQSADLAADAREADRAAGQSLMRVKEIEAVTLRRRRAEEERRAEEARRQAEAERRQREEAARLAQIEAEQQRARNLWASNLRLLREGKYGDALQAIQASRDAFETDPGKAAFETIVERVKYLQELRTFLTERLNEEPFRWGWIQKRSAEDVLGADPTGVRLRTGVVPWEQVTVAQMLHFIKKYLADRTLRVRTRAEQHIGAAIYCHIHGGFEFAQRYAERAGDLLPTLREKVKRIMPPEPEPAAAEPAEADE